MFQTESFVGLYSWYYTKHPCFVRYLPRKGEAQLTGCCAPGAVLYLERLDGVAVGLIKVIGLLSGVFNLLRNLKLRCYNPEVR